MSSTLLERCRATLLDWSAPDGEQVDLRGQYLQFLADRIDGWSRDCPGAHLTASSLICSFDGRVLLTLHRQLGRWLQTGGHLEPTDASLEAAALREATEESGLSGLVLHPDPLLLSRHEVPCGPVRPAHHLDVQYLVTVAAGDPVIGAESLDLRWFAFDALPDVDDSVRALVAAARIRLVEQHPGLLPALQTGVQPG